MLIPLLATLVGAFVISDTTDNDTQERTVWASTVADKSGPADVLHLSCINGRPVWSLRYRKIYGADWLTIIISAPGMAVSQPLIFQFDDDEYAYSYHGPSDDLTAKLREHPRVTFEAQSPFAPSAATFATEGIDVAWKRVADNCRADNG